MCMWVTSWKVAWKEGKMRSVLPWLQYAVHALETRSPLEHFSDPVFS